MTVNTGDRVVSMEGLVKLLDGYLAAYIAQDADGCASIFTPDAALISPFGQPARGRAAIAATHMEWFAENEQDKRIDVLEFHQHGAIGHCLLSWAARVPDEGTPGKLHDASGLSLGVLSFSDDGVLFSRMALVPDPA